MEAIVNIFSLSFVCLDAAQFQRLSPLEKEFQSDNELWCLGRAKNQYFYPSKKLKTQSL